MMKQYQAIKQQHVDCLLFYRMGDFYELFLDDAYIGAKVLNITLTSRAKGKDGRIPMAGVPYHAVDPYLSKLVKAGYKVAICEQVGLPSKYGIVDREVVRIVTPGTITDEHAIEKKENNFLISLSVTASLLTIAACDLSTGQIQIIEHEGSPQASLQDELARIQPAECILSPADYANPELLSWLKTQNDMSIFPFNEWQSFEHQAYSLLKSHFNVKTLEPFGIDDKPHAVLTAATLLGYLKVTQKDRLGHIKTMHLTSPQQYLEIDRSTMLNLELFSTIRNRDDKGSLLSVIDYTKTAMGGRLLRSWIRHPLAHREPLIRRLDAVEDLVINASLSSTLVKTLLTISDIERVVSRLALGIGNPRDLISLKNALQSVVQLQSELAIASSSLLQELATEISVAELEKLRAHIEKTINEQPPINPKEGGIIQSGISEKLDGLRTIVGSGKQWMLELEAQERNATGINSLKIRYNKVFGFYIEVTNANLLSVPATYQRKQTMVGGERFTTPALKQREVQILHAQEQINTIEFELFTATIATVLESVATIQQAARAVATIDVLVGFSELARKWHYTKPTLLYSDEIRITEGRHPVVEQLELDTEFVPNSVTLNTTSNQLLLLTGPNMAGKSVLIRQVALIVLLCQLGSFVPATKAHLGLVDKLFVRSGASDMITAGLSTFMVEMVETAYILNHATPKSLIVMDEIGRGTSTYDGISIAWAIAANLVSPTGIQAKTLFATHYHELQALEKEYPTKIQNMHLAVDHRNDQLVFLHTLQPGGASHSFGVAVARLAGIPSTVIEDASKILASLEQRSAPLAVHEESTLPPRTATAVLQSLGKIDLLTTTPLQALSILATLQEQLNKNEIP
ncbi:DNA mismatch repair protein MutS [Candidatus Woesebacteria bacterium]|nr:DNA mismatch repair protein MutS [Candidatus Woesebacteria bacterium]